MKRAVFNPKAYAFVNTQKHGVIDVTEYIISGRVNRRLNAISSASLELQNPDMIFTKEDGIRLTPMDPIVIYLERKKGFAVKVFTGFVDESPYYQLLPGPVTIKASCTLKRLLHTYFDPGLMYTQRFLVKYGWLPQADGTVLGVTGQDNTSGEFTVEGGGSAGSGDFGFGGSGIQGAYTVAKAISNKKLPYSYGGGHVKAGVPNIGREGVVGFDCSGFVTAILAGAKWGFEHNGSTAASSGFASWGKPGRGKVLTVWYNANHVFIHFEKPLPGGFKRADTSPHGDGGRGPQLRNNYRSTDGFTPRHWEGF